MELNERLKAKVFAKISQLSVEIKDLEVDLKYLIKDGMVRDMTTVQLNGARRELELWEYISELAENNI